MNISICITTFKETEESVNKLLDSLKHQSVKADEIILIDAKDYNNCSRAKGRNIAVKKAKNEIIVMTDVGCIPKHDWLEKITKPFSKSHPRGVIDVVAGFYSMTYKNNFEKAERRFLGTDPKDFDNNFLPSTRSIAFTKAVWKKVGGFSEDLGGTAEDTVFNAKLLNNNVNIVREKKAIVEWGMPKSIFDFYFKIFNYTKGDMKSKILFFPGKGFTSHNIHSLFVLFRSLFGFTLFILSIILYLPLPYFLIYLFAYLLFAFSKVGLWGFIIQPTADLAVIMGLLNGIF